MIKMSSLSVGSGQESAASIGVASAGVSIATATSGWPNLRRTVELPEPPQTYRIRLTTPFCAAETAGPLLRMICAVRSDIDSLFLHNSCNRLDQFFHDPLRDDV